MLCLCDLFHYLVELKHLTWVNDVSVWVISRTVSTIFFRLSAQAQISAQGLFFTVRGGMTSANVTEKLVKLPPRRSKKSEITYLSSCRVCKPALNSAISAVPLRSYCSYSPHDRTFDQLVIFSLARAQRCNNGQYSPIGKH